MLEAHIAALIALPSAAAAAGKVAVYVLLLSVLIIFHEFGHFIAAKRARVTVTDFAVGFGPSLLALRRGDTTYRVNLLPLGGYCRMAGEDTASSSADPGNFTCKSLAARFAIIAAGPVFNLILAAVAFAAVAAIVGEPVAPTTRVAAVEPQTAAARAGLSAGDVIVALDGRWVHSGQDMLAYIRSHAGRTVDVTVLRRGALLHLAIADTLLAGPDGRRRGAFGFIPAFAYARQPVLAALGYGVTMVGTVAAAQLVGIVEAIRQHDTSVIHGPVGIARIVIGVEGLGPVDVVQIGAELSVVLGLINLLPFPALDGGRLAFLLVEALRGRPVDAEREGLIHAAGFAVLMLLVMVVTYRDIVQWVQGKGGL